jgi:hypothetical protein
MKLKFLKNFTKHKVFFGKMEEGSWELGAGKTEHLSYSTTLGKRGIVKTYLYFIYFSTSIGFNPI